MKNNQNSLVIGLLLIVIALLVIGGGLFIYSLNLKISQSANPTVPQITATNTPVSSDNSNSDIAGMQQYTDNDFGFSFWYPSDWQVTPVSVQDANKYAGGTIVKQLNVQSPKGLVTVEEFTSPTFSITDKTGVGACPVCNTTHYYFDATAHTWMVEYPEGTSNGTSGAPAPANVSFDTMGGLHMLAGSHRFGGNTIIPLSASNFLVVTVDGGIATGSSDPKALAKTVVTTDPDVATPWSADLQTQTIQAEQSVFAAMQ